MDGGIRQRRLSPARHEEHFEPLSHALDLIGEVFDTGLGPLKDMEKEMQELTDRFSRMLSRRPSRSSGTREALTVADWSP